MMLKKTFKYRLYPSKAHYLPLTYAVYGAAAMLALLFIRETRDIRLEDLDTTDDR